jgi:hypothetical protein
VPEIVVWLDRAAIAGLALGLTLYVMPLWPEGRLRWAFWSTLIATALHIYTSHARSAEGAASDAAASRAGRSG